MKHSEEFNGACYSQEDTAHFLIADLESLCAAGSYCHTNTNELFTFDIVDWDRLPRAIRPGLLLPSGALLRPQTASELQITLFYLHSTASRRV